LLRSKNKALNIKRKISKKLLLQLLLFTGIIAGATVFDSYFDNNEIEIETASEESDNTANEPAKVYLFSQVNNLAAKTSAQKNTSRKYFEQHTKFLQRYHESKNFRDLKLDEKKPKTPLFLSFHYLIFRNYFFSLPDDDTHLA